MSKARAMKVNGRKISNTARELKPGQRGLTTWVGTFLAKRRGEVSTDGLTALCTMVNGKTIKSMGLASISGKTVVSTTDLGWITTCLAMEFTSTLTVSVTTDNTLTTRKKDSGYITGLMAESMKAGGTRESSMALERITIIPKSRLDTVSGKTENALSGTTNPSIKRSARVPWIIAASTLSLKVLMRLKPW